MRWMKIIAPVHENEVLWHEFMQLWMKSFGSCVEGSGVDAAISQLFSGTPHNAHIVRFYGLYHGTC